MTREEQEEFRNLKYARAEQGGYFTAEQKERWDYLHGLHGEELLKKIKIMDEKIYMKMSEVK